MLLPLVTLALLGAAPCNLSLLSPAAQMQAAMPSPLLQDDCSEALAQYEASRPLWARGTVTFLGSALGAAVGSAAGGLLGYAMAGGCSGDCYVVPPELLVGAVVGFPLGAALGAHITGNVMGGNGQWSIGRIGRHSREPAADVRTPS